MTRTTSSTDQDVLPVPRESLVELGLSDDDIQLAVESAPLVRACQAADAPGAYFDVDAVAKVLTALAAFKHTKGRWSGRRIRLGEGLDAWQIVWVIAPIFGWLQFDEEAQRPVRVIRTVWIEVPRKNGKSTLSSAIANVLLLADGEPGAEVYAAAGSTTQAGRVFEDARRMCLTAPAARKRVEPLKDLLRVPKTGSFFRVLSRVAEVAHGLNVHGAVIDEIHTLRLRRQLVEAIETGTGARDQPLIVKITTADAGEEGTIYDEDHRYTRKVADRVVTGDAAWSWYGVIWAAEATDDPWVEETWLKANPGLRAGSSPTMAYMRKEAAKAQNTPSKKPAFLQLHLDLRVRDATRLIDVPTWDRCAGMVDRDQLKGRAAYGGLDLSAVSDFSAWWIGVIDPYRDGAMKWLWRFWVPEDRVPILSEQLQVPLKDWIKDGWVETTEGDVIDYDVIEKVLIADCRFFDMKRLSYDRMFAGQLVQNVEAETGVEVAPVSQTYMGLSPAIKEMDRLLKVGAADAEHGRTPTVEHGGHPVARWMATQVEARNDHNDNLKLVKPDRAKASARIDGIQALATGLDGWVRRPIEQASYVYTA